MPPYKEMDLSRIAALVRVDDDLRNIRTPKSTYAMSPAMIAERRDLRDQLAQELGLSEDKTMRARQIGGHKGYLIKIGYPFWRINGASYEAKPGEIIELRELAESPA